MRKDSSKSPLVQLDAGNLTTAQLKELITSLPTSADWNYNIQTQLTDKQIGTVLSDLIKSGHTGIGRAESDPVRLQSTSTGIDCCGSLKTQHRMLDCIPNNVYIVDMRNGEVEYVNQLVESSMGVDFNQIRDWGENYLDHCMSPDFVESARANIASLLHLKDGEVRYFEYKMVRENGEVYWIGARESVLERDEMGNVARIIGSSADITDYKQMIARHEFNEKRISFILNSLPIVTYTALPDADFTPKTVSANLAEVLGHDPAEFIGNNNWHQLVHPDDRESLLQSELQAALEREFSEFEFRMQHKLGHYVWIKKRSRVIRDKFGVPLEVVGMIEDVSVRKLSQSELEKTRDKLQLAMETAGVGLWIWDMVTGEVEYDAQMNQIMGLDPDDPVYRFDYFMSCLSEEDRKAEIARATDKENLKENTNKIFELFIPGREGVTYVHIKAKVICDKEGNPIYSMGTALDITPIKEAERRIKESELKFRGIFNQSFQFVGLMTTEGNLLEINESALDFIDRKTEEVIGIPIWETRFWNQDERSKRSVQRMVAKAAGGEFVRREVGQLDADGRMVYIDFSIKPIFDSDGEVVFLIPEGRPITELKEAELKIKRLNESLEEIVKDRTESLQESNKELESFNYSVSHDLRTPIRGINTYSSLLKRMSGDKLDDEGKRLLNNISDNARIMSHLIDDLLSYSRLGRTEINTGQVDMEDMVRSEFDRLMALEGSRSIELVLHDCPDSRADSNLIQQLVHNLLTNAVKYTNKKEIAHIEFGGQELDDRVEYYIRDNGIGFDPKYADKIFGVFERLHGSEFEGTGVGLAIVKRIVDRHGGNIWAESTPNEGTTISFSLPKSTKHVAESVL